LPQKPIEMTNDINITMRYFLIGIGICLIWSCGTDTTQGTTTTNPPNNIAKAALEAVRDSMQMETATFEQVQSIVLKYEEQLAATQKKAFNNPKSKQQVIQNLMKSRRTELRDILKPKEVMTFNRLYKKNKTDERKQIRDEKKLSEEDRKKLAEEVKQYRIKSVLPIVVKNRKALEAAMPSEGKARIADLREKMTDFNERFKAQKASCTNMDKTDKKAVRTCRRELQNMKKQYDPIKKEVELFSLSLQNNQATKSIMDDMEKQRQIWRTDLKKMLDIYTKETTPVDKIPLGKYFRLAQSMPFLMLDPDKIDDSAFEE